MDYPTIKTRIHWYGYDIRSAGTSRGPSRDGLDYASLCARLRSTEGRGSFHNVLSDPSKDRWATRGEYVGHESEEIELQTKYLFNNQWNTVCGRRVFDWFEAVYPDNRTLKMGHYLDITPEMIEIRNRVRVCGYCGHHYRDAEDKRTFCDCCLASEYLKIEDLRLLRLLPVSSSFRGHRPELTDDEKSILVPAYNAHRLPSGSLYEKRRREVLAERDKNIFNESRRAEGYLWFIDRGFDTDNLIYYGHTGSFCLGWRTHIKTEAEVESWKSVAAEFPFRLTIRTGENEESVLSEGVTP